MSAEESGDAAQTSAMVEATHDEMVQCLDGDYDGALKSSGDEDDEGDVDDFLRAIFNHGTSLEEDALARTALLANVPRRIVAKLAEMHDLSEYEVDRAINVATNRVHLHSLGIEPIAAPKAPVTARAKGKERAVVPVAQRVHPSVRSHGATLPLKMLEEGRFTCEEDPVRLMLTPRNAALPGPSA